MNELASTLREAVSALAASDRAYKRFGARVHRYELRPPAEPPPELPADVATLIATFSSGGAGPYYGWQIGASYRLGDRDARVIGHMGCGYAAVLIDGAVWIDASAIDIVRPIAETFTELYLDWVERLAHNALPEAFVPPGACALANALGGFLGIHEQRLGLAPGTIDGEPLRDALAQLGPGAIEIAAQRSPLFADGTRVDPCIACAKLLANLGLSDDVVSPGR